MPQEHDKEKEADVVAYAIFWYCNYVTAARAFRVYYSIYYDEIITLMDCYKMYYPEQDGKVVYSSSELEKLITITKERREQKLEEGIKFFTVNQWMQVCKLCKSISDRGQPKLDKIRQQVKCILEGQTNGNYSEIAKTYSAFSFEKSLNFIHTSARQHSFLEISSKLKEQKAEQKSRGQAVASVNGRLQTSKQKENFEAILEDTTVKKAWGMSGFIRSLNEFINIMSADGPENGVWYLVQKKDEAVIPTALKYAGQNKKEEAIYRSIEQDLMVYLQKYAGQLSGIKEYEAIARMTVNKSDKESNQAAWRSNMIAWKGNLFAALPEKIEEAMSVYLFSPQRYLTIRKEKGNQKQNHLGRIDQKLESSSIPMIFGGGNPNEEYCYFIRSAATEQKIRECEKTWKGKKNCRRRIFSNIFLSRSPFWICRKTAGFWHITFLSPNCLIRNP